MKTERTYKSVWVSEKLHARLKLLSATKKITIAQVIETAIKSMKLRLPRS